MDRWNRISATRHRPETLSRHCEERSDEAIQSSALRLSTGLLRFARNDGVDGLTQTASSAKAWSPKRHRGKPSMKKFIRTAIDLGKTYFQVHGLESEGGQSISRKMKRSKMREFYEQIEPCRVGMEACGSGHYWARE